MIFYVLGFPWIQATETSVSKTHHPTHFQNQPAPQGISFEDMAFALSSVTFIYFQLHSAIAVDTSTKAFTNACSSKEIAMLRPRDDVNFSRQIIVFSWKEVSVCISLAYWCSHGGRFVITSVKFFFLISDGKRAYSHSRTYIYTGMLAVWPLSYSKTQ